MNRQIHQVTVLVLVMFLALSASNLLSNRIKKQSYTKK